MVAMVAGAASVLVAPVAAVPLFLSSVGTEAMAVQADDRCPRDSGVSYTAMVPTAEVPGLDRDPLAPLATDVGPVTTWTSQEDVELVGATPDLSTEAVVLARDGAVDHVDVLEGEPGSPGVWLPDRAARDTGLGPGDTATVLGAPMPVAGVYRDIAGTTVDDNWCAHADLLVMVGYDPVKPPPVLIADRATYAGWMADLGNDELPVTWEAPLRPDRTVAEGRALVDDVACATPVASELEWCGGDLPFDPADAEARDRAVSSGFQSHLPFMLDRADSIRASVGGGVWPVAGCAALAGVGFVAAAGALWSDRRRREVTLLTVRGVSPAALGLKAVLELLVPLVVGAAGGVGLAYVLVRWLGPSPVLESSAVDRAAVSGAVGLVAAMLVVGLVVARRTGALFPRPARARARRLRVPTAWLRLVPWELGLAAITFVSYRRLGEWGVPVSDGAELSRVDPLGLLFPVLFLLTAVGIAARLLVLGIGPLRSVSRGWPTWLYLAVRRVARYRVAVVGLVAASAVAAGVLGYAATLNRSLEASLDLKARAFVGSDVAIRITRGEELPAELADRATNVAVYRSAWIDAGSREVEVTVLGIDPNAFADATFWAATLADRGLDDILERLQQPVRGGDTEDGGTEGAVVPAVITGLDGLPDTVGARVRGIRTTRFRVEQVADAQGFPGMRRPTPTVFVAAGNLEGFDLTGSRTETWIRGDRDDILGALRDAGTSYVEARQADEVVDRVSFLTVAWTFDFVQAIALAAGVLVVGGLAAYLDARRRNRLLGYAFARRMGLTSGQHRRALLAELVASVVVGCWLGLGIALAGAWLAHGRIDPVPDYRPDPVLRPAGPVILALAVASAVLAVVAAAVAQRRTDGDDPVEVLRAGT
jgi:putative ABC transport system permease protein